MSELKPCPFCAGESATIKENKSYHSAPLIYVSCEQCWGRSGGDYTQELAIAAWNRRAVDIVEPKECEGRPNARCYTKPGESQAE